MQPRQSAGTLLDTLIDTMKPHTGADEVTMSGASYDEIVRQLVQISKLLNLLEREVGTLRLMDAARDGRLVVDRLAAEQFNELVRDPNSKIIRPDFGGRGPGGGR